jgi:hypothetical protein
VRTTVDLPAELIRAAKARAAAEGQTLKDFFTRAVTHELGGPALPRTSRARVVLPLIGTDGPKVEVTNADIEAILTAEDAEKYGRG